MVIPGSPRTASVLPAGHEDLHVPALHREVQAVVLAPQRPLQALHGRGLAQVQRDPEALTEHRDAHDQEPEEPDLVQEPTVIHVERAEHKKCISIVFAPLQSVNTLTWC